MMVAESDTDNREKIIEAINKFFIKPPKFGSIVLSNSIVIGLNQLKQSTPIYVKHVKFIILKICLMVCIILS